MFRSVVGVPEFAGDPEVFAGAESGVESGFDALADEGFVSVIASAVEVSVTDLDRFMDDFWCEFVGDFPRAEAGRREGGSYLTRVVYFAAT